MSQDSFSKYLPNSTSDARARAEEEQREPEQQSRVADSSSFAKYLKGEKWTRE